MNNEGQKEYWNGNAGTTWVEAQDRLDRLLAPISEVAVAAAAVVKGERVVDIGCGCGTTSKRLADDGAAVWGIDISAPMLTHAKTRFEDTSNLAFSQADASTQKFTADHQLLFSRFGVMFFDDPIAAFTNLRTALTADGRLVFACWQTAAANAWLSIVGRAVQPFLPQNKNPAPAPNGPDPFAFADTSYVEGILQKSGFRNVNFKSLTPTLHLADDLEGAIAFQTRIGPLSRVLAELQGNARDLALVAAKEALAPHVGPDGVRLGAAAWLVTASAA